MAFKKTTTYAPPYFSASKQKGTITIGGNVGLEESRKQNELEYVKVRGNKKIIMKKVGGKLKTIKVEELTPKSVKWFGGKK